MNPLALLPYALGAYGGYRGYQQARQSGASGLQALLGGATGAYGGYALGTTGLSMFPGSQAAQQFAAMPLTRSISATPGMPTAKADPRVIGEYRDGSPIYERIAETPDKGSLLDILRKEPGGQYDPLKVSIAAAGIPFALGAFNQGPTDIYTPGYNIGYAALREQRPTYTFIDPATGEEKAYEKIYAPESDPRNRGDFVSGPYAMNKTRLKTGGLAEIKKFNEGGINYLPSKVSHDENDANNYVRASGYVEDGSGNGDKDEDTMLAQLADGEFVTRADGVLGAGIIAGANPNSMKDMREKGAQYFYEQQRRYKRVFDLLQEANGKNSTKN